jgi:hypothetical protein
MGYTVKKLSKKNPYYISKERRMELEHFCKQYPEWLRGLKDMNFISGPSTELEVKPTDPSDCTYERAVKAIRYSSKIHLIEDTLSSVINGYMDENRIRLKIHNLIFNAMLKLITEGGSYDNSRLPDYISEYKYRQLRQQFFYILSERRD